MRTSFTGEQIVIRELLTPAEMKAAEEIQVAVWNRQEAVPAHMLLAQAKNGGIVLGAFTWPTSGPGIPVASTADKAGAELMIGMSHSFPGRDPGAVGSGTWLYSHMTGVLEPYRGSGVGFRMKLYQRKLAMEKGYAEIRWTFDPLYYPNARLNLAKLGGIVRTYLVDYYGELSDSFSSGIPSDRFLLQWYLSSRRVQALLDQGEGPHEDVSGGTSSPDGQVPMEDVIKVSYESGRAVPEEVYKGASGPVLTVPIPSDIGKMRREDLALVREWRLATREVFLHYLSAGYVVSGVTAPESSARWGGSCFRYVLTKPGPELCL